MKIEISGNGKFNWSFTVKLLILAFLALMLLIPLEMIKSVILDRQANSEQVALDISEQWGGTQVITGPVINIPLKEIKPKDDKKEASTIILHIMPESVAMSGNVKSELRSYGIYESAVYSAEITTTGSFSPEMVTIPEGYEARYKDSYLTLGISDNRGLVGEVNFSVNGNKLTAIPGTRDKEIAGSGVTFDAEGLNYNGVNDFGLTFKLNGSQGLYFTPTGRETTVNIQSDWDSPGFQGQFLPGERKIDENGFTASWVVTDLNRNFPQYWTGKAFDVTSEAFGFDMILPVDHYLKSHRSVRYGILFILLTFMSLLFIELMSGARLHIFHYILVALGLVLFFSILTSTSEHIGFGPAYLVSALAITGLLTYFTANLLKKRKYTIIFVLLLSGLYGFIYILLNLTDYAFLAGNIGLFVCLVAIMYLSLKVKFDVPQQQ